MDNAVPKPLFRDLDAEDVDPETSEIESLCLNCGENVSISLESDCVKDRVRLRLISKAACPVQDINNSEGSPPPPPPMPACKTSLQPFGSNLVLSNFPVSNSLPTSIFMPLTCKFFESYIFVSELNI